MTIFLTSGLFLSAYIMAPSWGIFYLTHISDIPQSPHTKIALFADDTIYIYILYTGSHVIEVMTHNLQDYLR